MNAQSLAQNMIFGGEIISTILYPIVRYSTVHDDWSKKHSLNTTVRRMRHLDWSNATLRRKTFHRN